MNESDNQKIMSKLYNVIYIVPTQYVKALLALHQKLEGKDISWIVNGDLAEALHTVNVDPDCMEIVCSKKDAEEIFQLVQDLNPKLISYQTTQMPRNAFINGKEFPVYIRSHNFDFTLESVAVKVKGDLQFRVGDWEWGDVFLFSPEYVYVVGKKTAVTPLAVKAELYQYLRLE